MELLSNELLYYLLTFVDLTDNLQFCVVNKYVNSIYEDEYFWKLKLEREFPTENRVLIPLPAYYSASQKYWPLSSSKRFYTDLKYKQKQCVPVIHIDTMKGYMKITPEMTPYEIFLRAKAILERNRYRGIFDLIELYNSQNEEIYRIEENSYPPLSYFGSIEPNIFNNIAKIGFGIGCEYID